MKKFIIYTIIAIFTFSCSIKSKSYYMLEGYKKIVQTHKLTNRIGVKKITLPRYFNQNSLAIKKGENRVVFIDSANWISDMDEQLTSVLIDFLKRYFNSTDIYLYPWEGGKKIDKIVNIKINSFIYDGKEVILDATWEIVDKDRSKARFFKTKVASKNSPDDIIKAMDRAFAKLQIAIARSLK